MLMSSRLDTIQKILEDRSPAILDDWFGAIKAPALSALSSHEARQLLSGLLERFTALLVAEANDPAEARAIGAAFVPLRLAPAGFGRVQGALVEHLLRDLPAELAGVLLPRLTVLVEGLAIGFIGQDRATLLQEQERMRDAYVHALRRAEGELRLKDAGVESSINAIAFFDAEGRVTYVNAAFLRMWGYDHREDVLGREIGAFGDWEYNASEVIEALDSEAGWVGERTACRKDGSQFDVLVSANTVRDKAGRLLQMTAFFADITELRRATRDLQRRVAQLALLNEIGDRIAGLLPPDEVMETAVRLVKDAFDYHQVAVFTVDRESGDMVVGAIAGAFEHDPPKGQHLPVEEGITGWVVRHGKTLVVDDVQSDPRYYRPFRHQVPTLSEMAVPIERAGGVMGVLDVQSPLRGAFGDADRTTLEILADQIAVALENARLYEALQNELEQRRKADEGLRRNLERLETLHDIDQAILGAKSMQEVAESALRHLRAVVPCQRAAIDVFDYQAGEVVILAAVQDTADDIAVPGTRFPMAAREYTQALLAGPGHVDIEDILQLPQSAPLIQAVRDLGMQSFVVAPIRAGGELMGMLGLGMDRPGGFDPEHGPIVQEVANSIAVAIQQARLLESLREHGERIREAMARLGEAEEAERRRVVRVLHDCVGQNLTALDLNLSLVRSRLAERDSTELCSRVDMSLSLVEETNEEIRRLMAEVRPSVLDDYGLSAALRWYAGTFCSRTGIAVTVRGDLEGRRDLPSPVENALFRIAQEALHNTAKHAQATLATVNLSEHGAGIRLTISDDGMGFDPSAAHAARNNWGLLTMRERAESVGAQCVVDSSPDRGTCVTVDVPL